MKFVDERLSPSGTESKFKNGSAEANEAFGRFEHLVSLGFANANMEKLDVGHAYWKRRTHTGRCNRRSEHQGQL